LVRHLTGDPPAVAKRATRLLRDASELFLADLIVAETIDVLESFYEVATRTSRSDGSLLTRRQVDLIDRSIDRVTTVERVEPK
jgi:hypothetical protein